MSKSVTNYASWFVNECARVAAEGWRSMCRVDSFHFLYYKPNGLALVIAPEAPDGFVLGESERVPSNLTVEQLTMWVHRHASRLPILPGD